MLFGVTNTLAIFLNLMNIVLTSFFDKFVVFFIDDILEYFKNEYSYAKHLSIVLETLSFMGSLASASFSKGVLPFLAIIISGDGISIVLVRLQRERLTCSEVSNRSEKFS